MDKQILIVDDEKNIRTTIIRSLEPLGYHVDQAVSAEEALEYLLIHEYDLVLLDLKLPQMSGMELIAQLSDHGMKTKIIIISAHGTVQTAVSCLKQGALDFIEKPFSPDEIRQIVTKYV